MIGSMDRLCKFADEPFDFIICHNVLEYTEDRADINCKAQSDREGNADDSAFK